MSIPTYPYPQFLPQNAAAVTKDNTLVNQLYYLLQALFLRTGGNGGVVTTVGTPTTAAGTTQVTAPVLANDVNIVTTGSGGVRLPNVQPGQFVYVFNATAAAINVYPSTGGTIDSLAVNAPSSLAAGFGQIYIGTSVNAAGATTFNVFLPSFPQTILTADTTFYVRTDGNDTNDGRINSPSGAFLTIQGAWNSILNRFILGSIVGRKVGAIVTISVQPGTYTTDWEMGGLLIGQIDVSQLVLFGPSTAIINVNSGVGTAAIYIYPGALLTIDGGITIKNSGAGNCLYIYGASVNLRNVTYGSCGAVQISGHDGAYITINPPYSITGGAFSHWRSTTNSLIHVQAGVITLTGTPAFSGDFADVNDGGVLQVETSATVSFSGGATGKRWTIFGAGGAIDTGGTFAADQNFFPGNAAGVALGFGSFNDRVFAGSLFAFDGGGIGYGPAGAGTGGTVTQLTSKGTAVTLNTITGQITTSNSLLAPNAPTGFVVNNTTVAATDVVILNLKGGAANALTYEFGVNQVNAGSFVIYITNTSAGNLSEALVFNFAVIKGVIT
jgi:hypothetical protein